MVVQDYASGQACCVHQYQYESQLIHTTGKTWYIVLCQHTMYVISLSNISIKANVKQITRLELLFTILWGRLHCVNDVTFFVAVLSPMSITVQTLSVSLYNPTTLLKRKRGPYNCRKYWYYVFTLSTLMFSSPDSNDMTSWKRKSAENVSCNVAQFFYHHSVVIQHLLSDTMYHTGSIH